MLTQLVLVCICLLGLIKPVDPGAGDGVVIGGHSGLGGTKATVDISGGNSSGSQPGQSPSGPNPESGSNGASGAVDPCWYDPVPYTSLTASLFAGNDHTTGTLYRISCPDSINVATGKPVYSVMGYTFAAAGAAPVAPPPDPQVLARQAYGELPIPNPTIHLGPNPDRLAVKIWTWLWIDNPGPLSKTVTARGLSVTATATLASTTWSMGEPTTGNSAAAVTCTGPGQPPPAGGYDWKAQPPCGYLYHWKSTPERTHGAGAWPITTTATWRVTWTATNGTNGVLDPPLQTTTTTAATIGEYRTILVDSAHK